jgi:hypothetical protein
VVITSELGHRVTTLFNLHAGWQETLRGPNSAVRCTLPQIPFTPGRFYFGVELRNSKELLDRIDTVGMIDVLPGDVFGSGRAPKARDGILCMASEWGQFSEATAGSMAARRNDCQAFVGH